ATIVSRVRRARPVSPIGSPCPNCCRVLASRLTSTPTVGWARPPQEVGRSREVRGPMDAARSTDASPCAVAFIGDLDDPWLAAIADAASAGRPVHRVSCAGTLPDWPFEPSRLPRAVIIHRHALATTDAERLKQ